MKPSPEIKSIARPLRVAYVIEDGEYAHQFLDAAFSESFSRHSGRQSLVVPVLQGEISKGYIQYLKDFDADVAFVVTSNNQLIGEMLAQVSSPLLIYPIDNSIGEESSFRRFKLPENALTSLSWLPYLKIVSGRFHTRPEEILDCYPHWVDDGLITDNFGTLYNSFDAFPLHRELSDLIKPLILTPVNAPEDRWKFGIEATEVHNAYDVLTLFERPENRVSLAYLSNIFSKNSSNNLHKWNDSFCMVIGDSFLDRVSCWNAGLLFNDAQHQAYKTLRLPSSVLNDASKIDKIMKFINGNNWINRNNGQGRVTVRSSSLSLEELNEFVTQINVKGNWCSYTAELITSIDECCPPPKDKESRWSYLNNNSDLGTPLRHESESVLVPQPFHLKHATAHPVCYLGQWVVEYTIDRTRDNNRFENLRDSWLIPNRNQLAGLFVYGVKGRITARGAISVQVDNKIQRIEIHEPSDINFFHALLHKAEVYSYPDIRHQKQLDIAYEYSRRSDKGRYLQGVLGMFGSLNRAYRVLTHSFWRRQFIKLGSPSESQYPQLIQTLKKRFTPQKGKFIFERDEQWEKLAKVMVSQAVKVRQPKYTIKLNTLQKEWEHQVELAINADEHLKEYRLDMLKSCHQDLTDSLAELCREGVFHQGYNWTCRQCGYQNWAALDVIKMELVCQVCHDGHNTPIDLQFDFRMNEFLATCIREHDTLSVIWALGKLQEDSNAFSFIFAPQMEMFRKFPNNLTDGPDREIDMLCVVDGKVVIGEVKASMAEIDNQEIDNLIQLAHEIHPDIIIIAIMRVEKGDEVKLNAKLELVRKSVSADIDVRGLMGDINEIEYYLP